MEILDDRSVIYQLEVYKKWYEEQQEEIKRLNNIIDELEKWLKETNRTIDFNYVVIRVKDILDKLKELKGSDE